MRIGTIVPIDTVLNAVRKTPTTHRMDINGASIKPSDTLRMFALKGTICVRCGRNGEYFLYKENVHGGYLTLVLYHNTPDGRPNYMTRDHILPKSLGGADHMSNIQPMCIYCNNQKNTSVDDDLNNIPLHLYPQAAPNVQRQLEAHSPHHFVDPSKLDINIHRDYIIWCTRQFHKNARLRDWAGSGVRSAMLLKVSMIMGDNFNFKAFDLAYDMLSSLCVQEQHNIQHRVRGQKHLYPRVYFSSSSFPLSK